MKNARSVCVIALVFACFSERSSAQAPSDHDRQAASTPDQASRKPDATETAPATPNPEAIKEAGQRYQRGLELYSEGDYGLAVIEFERAYELVPNYRVLYNIGQVRIQLGRYAKARRALEEYLAQGGDEIKAERREAVRSDIEMLTGRTAFLTIITNEAGVEVFMDNVSLGPSPLTDAQLVDAGEHTVEVRKIGYYGKTTQVKLAGREALTVTLNITKVPDASAGAKVVVQRMERQPMAPKPDRTTMWIGWAATATLAVGAATFGYLGINKANDLESMRTDYGVTRKELDDTKNSAQTLFMVGDIMGGAAAIAAGVSLYLTLNATSLKNPPKDREPLPVGNGLALGFGPSRLMLGGNF